MSNFVHCHVHTEFSMLDGLGSVEQYVSRAKKLKQPALAITDHGTLGGAPRFYHEARENGIEPIIGCEFYFVDDAAWRPAKGEGLPERCHVVMLARGHRGYEVLSELVTESHRNFYYKPLLDEAMCEALGDDAQHLVVLSGCAASPVSRAILEGQLDYAREAVQWWREVFPHFYIELQHHDTDFDRELNTALVKLAKRYRVPHIITNDPHYVVEEDAHNHDALLAIQTASDIDDPNRFRFDGEGYHLRTTREMKEAFADYNSNTWATGYANTQAVAKLCHLRIPQWEKRTWHIPEFPDVEDSYAELRRLTTAGLRAFGRERDSTYRARAVEELKAIKEAGIADVLLITQDVIRFAREQGIRVGPGRGSVCGTLVGYLTGIHKIDPVRYDLRFDRFLNAARPRMPDIDTDFEQGRREELFDYVKTKYGSENVVHVAMYQNMKLKAAFRSLAKAHGVPFQTTNRLANQLPDEVEVAEWPKEFEKEVSANWPDLLALLKRLAGVKRAFGTHPAGIIIARPEDNIRRLVPEFRTSSKQMCGMYDLDAAEEMGLLKQDFLGLRNLNTVQESVELIEQSTGERIEPDDWVPDEEEGDEEVWEMLKDGYTAGVFQMEGPVNTNGIKKIKPTGFEDVVSCTALYRTGAISAGFPKQFLENRKRDRRYIKWLIPELKPILEQTWGVVLYQEQVMEMAEHIAGFDMERVDDIKEAIKHKKSEFMNSLRQPFIEGALATVGCTQSQAEQLWHMIEGYSGYGYNRSHAVAYTMLTYQTARLKAFWPRQFYVALLRTVEATSDENKAKRDQYLNEAVSLGMKVNPPDINRSGAKAKPTKGGLRFGFQDIAGIGGSVAGKLVSGRPTGGYQSLEAVEDVVRNRGAMKALADAGALASLGLPGSPERQTELLGWAFHDRIDRAKYTPMLVTPEMAEETNLDVVLIGEIVRVHKGATTKKGDPYITIHIRWDTANTWDVRLWSDTKKLWDDLTKGTIIMVKGKWERRWENISISDPKKVRVLTKSEPAPDASKRYEAAGKSYSTEINDEAFELLQWLVYERYNIYLAKQAGEPPPWTDDEMLSQYFFCNVFRADDKTSVNIHRRCRRVRRDPGLHYVEAVLGRHLNRVDTLDGLPRRWWERMSQDEFQQYVANHTLGSAAYKIHTPLGINRADGIAQLVFTELKRRNKIANKLLKCTSMQEAHAYTDATTTSQGLTAYQVLLDLYQTGFWPDDFDDQWCFLGIGAVRGARLLTGTHPDVTRKENMGGITQPLRDFAWAVLTQMVERMQEDWPEDWPAFDIHTGETMLCEYDKYVSKSAGYLHGRRYRT